MKSLAKLAITILLVLNVGCSGTSRSIKSGDVSGSKWKTINLGEGLTYDGAWQKLLGFAEANWYIETADKDTGYLRTHWGFRSNLNQGIEAPVIYKNRLNAKFIGSKQLKVWVESFYYYHDEGFPTDFGTDHKYIDNIYAVIAGMLSAPPPPKSYSRR